MGNLGRALLAFRGFYKKGFDVAAVFDNDPEKAGQRVTRDSSLKIQTLDELPETVRLLAVFSNSHQWLYAWRVESRFPLLIWRCTSNNCHSN